MEICLLDEFIPFGRQYLEKNRCTRPPSPSSFSHRESKTNRVGLKKEEESTATSPSIFNDIYLAATPLRSISTKHTIINGAVQLSPGYVVGEKKTHIYQDTSDLISRVNLASKWRSDEGFDEELYLADSQIIWSKAGRLVRLFSFNDERYPVSHALWVWFNDPNQLLYSDNDSNDDDNNGNDGNDATRINSKEKRKIRALCVLSHDIARFYLEDGRDYTVSIPVPVIYAWALDTGLLIQRRPQEDEQETQSKKLPVLWSLIDPLNQFKPVSIESSSSSPSSLDDFDTSHQMVQWMSLKHDVCWVSDHIDYPWCITRHHSTGQHQLWRYTCRLDNSLEQLDLKRSSSLLSLRREASSLSHQRVYSTEFDTTVTIKYFQEMTSDISLKHIWEEPLPTTTISSEEKESSNHTNSQVFSAHCITGDIVIGIMDVSNQLLSVYKTSGGDTLVNMVKLFSIPALSAVALCATRRHQRDILILRPDHTLELWHGYEESFVDIHTHNIMQGSLLADMGDSTLSNEVTERRPRKQPRLDSSTKSSTIKANKGRSKQQKRIVHLQLPVYNRVNLVLNDGMILRVVLNFTPQSSIVRQCFDALGLVLSDTTYPMVLKRFLHYHYGSNTHSALHLSDQREWNDFHTVLISCYPLESYPTVEGDESHQNDNANSNDAWQWLQGSRLYRQHQLDMPMTKLDMSTSTTDALVKTLYERAIQLRNGSDYPTLPEKCRASLFYAFHLIYEDFKLNSLLIEDRHRLGRLLVQLATFHGWMQYIDHYWRDGEIIPDTAVLFQSKVEPMSYFNDQLKVPPCIFSTWSQLRRYEQSISEHHITNVESSTFLFPHPLDIPKLLGVSPLGRIRQDICVERTQQMMEIYEAFRMGDLHKVIENLVKHRWTRAQLETLPLSIGLLLHKAIHYSQWHPNYHWSVDAYRLIGREDLIARTWTPQQWLEYHVNQIKVPSSSSMKADTESSLDEIYDGTTVNDNEITRLRFKEDQRVAEVQRLLQSARLVKLRVPNTSELSDHALSEHQLEHVYQLASRTLSRPAGRALLTYATVCEIDQSRLCPIPRLEVAARIIGNRTTTRLDDTQLNATTREWPEFHNGVAASLRFCPPCPIYDTDTASTSTMVIDSSWISLNKPEELDSQYGGFLYGLGLNGHLRELVSWHSYNYLTAKNDSITAGLLLGLAASYCGTMNDQVSRILNVHIPAILPRGGADLLPTSYLPAVSLLGIGLLYMESGHRRMTDVMLREVNRVERTGCDSDDARQESYTLAAGFALGFITLGQGDHARALRDVQITHVLGQLIDGSTDSTILSQITNSNNSANNEHDMEKDYNDKSIAGKSLSSRLNQRQPLNMLSIHGAIIALGLLYFQTNDTNVASRLAIPTSPFLLDQIRPDLLILRTVCYHLILWHDIRPTLEWIKGQIPQYVRDEREQLDRLRTSSSSTTNHAHNNGNGNDDGDNHAYRNSIQMAWCRIAAGTCLAIGLRFAGTANEDASNVLNHYFHEFQHLTNKSGTSFEIRMLRTAAREGLASIAMAWSMVMAGTGDLVTLKALRQLQNRVSADVHYGHHMASHMALGLLFLGGGRFTLSRQPKAIALLLCAAYPHWPSHPSDQRPHLQLLRHFWAMAVEPRCIVIREIASGQVCSLPLEVELVQPTTTTTTTTTTILDDTLSTTHTTSTRWITITSPCLLPELDRVKTIRLNASVGTHFPVELSLQACPYQFDPYSQTWTILVKPATDQYPSIQGSFTSTTITEESILTGLPSINDWLISDTLDPLIEKSWLFQFNDLPDTTRAHLAIIRRLSHQVQSTMINQRQLSSSTTTISNHTVIELQCIGLLNDMITNGLSMESWLWMLALYLMARQWNQHSTLMDPLRVRDVRLAIDLLESNVFNTATNNSNNSNNNNSKAWIPLSFIELLRQWIDQMVDQYKYNQDKLVIHQYYHPTNEQHHWPRNTNLRSLLIWLNLPSRFILTEKTRPSTSTSSVNTVLSWTHLANLFPQLSYHALQVLLDQLT